VSKGSGEEEDAKVPALGLGDAEGGMTTANSFQRTTYGDQLRAPISRRAEEKTPTSTSAPLLYSPMHNDSAPTDCQ
jgi:hypothetical protein